MSLTVNPYYNGKNGDARKFAQEMEDKGIAGRIRAEEGNEKYDLHMRVERYISDDSGVPASDQKFIRK